MISTFQYEEHNLSGAPEMSCGAPEMPFGAPEISYTVWWTRKI